MTDQSSLFDAPDDDRPVPARRRRRIHTVAELTASIRGLLESSFSDVWVEGELSAPRLWRTGHLYFALKDESAQIKGVMFKSAVRYMRFRPEDGLHVLVRGRVGVYDPKGEYQLVADLIEPRGVGARSLAVEQLKRRLQADGLFDPGRKRPLPVLPRRIGIVTSLDGAALRDIVRVLRQRHAPLHLVIRPVRVQGDGSAADITRGLRAICDVDDVDVVVLARGGGSAEDLEAFNDERLARAIAACPIPVVAGIGHEIDTSIADLVADVRAATPSHAAELVVGPRELVERLHRLDRGARRAIETALGRRRTSLQLLDHRPGFAGLPGRVAMHRFHAGDLAAALARAERSTVAAGRRRLATLGEKLGDVDPRARLSRARSSLAALQARLSPAVTAARHRADGRLRTTAGGLAALNPLAVLGRGYALCWTGDGRHLVSDASSLDAGDEVRVQLRDGTLSCSVLGRPDEGP